MIIDPNSVLSAYDEKCTLLQAINALNKNLEEFNKTNIYNHFVSVNVKNENSETEAQFNFNVLLNEKINIITYDDIKNVVLKYIT